MATTSEQAIVQHVLEAISDYRLKAGTKLGEQALSDIFSCNRANVRRALIILSARKVVELRPNRGAFVAMPTPEEARDVFQARRAIEKTIVRSVTRNAAPRHIARLRDNIARDRAARSSGNRRDAIRLSGEFHLILGEAGGNIVLAGFLRELVLRSSLIIGLYASADAPLCEEHDHCAIVDAIDGGDEAGASDLIDAHLRHIEASVRFEKESKPEDLHAILAVR